ncbi:hypothetical protein B0H13DRAFT_2447093 [Mycena leptocephala]|nr:hypothetical protein B0H13DRAFT_2447093 [Mycena leptocephala]
MDQELSTELIILRSAEQPGNPRPTAALLPAVLQSRFDAMRSRTSTDRVSRLHRFAPDSVLPYRGPTRARADSASVITLQYNSGEDEQWLVYCVRSVLLTVCDALPQPLRAGFARASAASVFMKSACRVYIAPRSLFLPGSTSTSPTSSTSSIIGGRTTTTTIRRHMGLRLAVLAASFPRRRRICRGISRLLLTLRLVPRSRGGAVLLTPAMYMDGLERFRTASRLRAHLRLTAFAGLQLSLRCAEDASRAMWWVGVATPRGRPSSLPSLAPGTPRDRPSTLTSAWLERSALWNEKMVVLWKERRVLATLPRTTCALRFLRLGEVVGLTPLGGCEDQVASGGHTSPYTSWLSERIDFRTDPAPRDHQAPPWDEGRHALLACTEACTSCSYSGAPPPSSSTATAVCAGGALRILSHVGAFLSRGTSALDGRVWEREMRG